MKSGAKTTECKGEAEDKDLQRIAPLFRAVAATEDSAWRELSSQKQRSTEFVTLGCCERLKKMVKKPAALVFPQARDVEDGHARLYKRALPHLQFY